MTVRSIAADSWAAELERFSRQHEGWLVSIKTWAPDGEVAVEAYDLPLLGVSPSPRESSDITVALRGVERKVTHDVHDVVGLRLDLTDDEADRALLIDAKDGSTTTVEFRSPMRAEQVDGLPR